MWHFKALTFSNTGMSSFKRSARGCAGRNTTIYYCY